VKILFLDTTSVDNYDIEDLPIDLKSKRAMNKKEKKLFDQTIKHILSSVKDIHLSFDSKTLQVLKNIF
jgi:hypothetical protein